MFITSILLKSFFVEDDGEKKFIIDYITKEFPLIYKRMVDYIAHRKVSYLSLSGVYETFGITLVEDVLAVLDYEEDEIPFVINSLSKLQKTSKKYVFDFELIRYLYLYSNVKILTQREKKKIISAIQNLDERTTREILLKHFKKFKRALTNTAFNDGIGVEYILEEIEKQLTVVYRQLSLFDI